MPLIRDKLHWCRKFYNQKFGFIILPKVVKRYFSIALISFFFLNFLGVYLYFGVRLMQIRTEMKTALRNLPNEKLTTFTFTESELKQVRVDEGEIKVKGKMYDIARMERADQNIIIYALHDVAEDNLLAFLDEIARRPLEDKQAPPSQLFQLITLTFIAPVQYTFTDKDENFRELNARYLRSSLNIHHEIESPPPQA